MFGCIAGLCFLLVQRTGKKDMPVIAMETDSVSAPAETNILDEAGISADYTQSGIEAGETERADADCAGMLYAGYEKVKESLVTVLAVYGSSCWPDEEPSKTGSLKTFGIVIAENSEEYYILTGEDPLWSAESVYVEIGGRLIEAKMQASNRTEDIGILSVEKSNLPADTVCRAAALGSTAGLQPGDSIGAAGCPYSFVGSVNCGTITYIGEEETYDGIWRILYTDMASVSDSSGVLFNEKGELTAWIIQGRAETLSGLICGVAMEDIRVMLTELVAGESTPYLGVLSEEVTGETAELYGVEAGLYIRSLDEDSPAKQAGLQPGDYLVSLDGERTESSRSIQELLGSKESGDTVTITVKRMVQEEYEEIDLEAVLGER